MWRSITARWPAVAGAVACVAAAVWLSGIEGNLTAGYLKTFFVVVAVLFGFQALGLFGVAGRISALGPILGWSGLAALAVMLAATAIHTFMLGGGFGSTAAPDPAGELASIALYVAPFLSLTAVFVPRGRTLGFIGLGAWLPALILALVIAAQRG